MIQIFAIYIWKHFNKGFFRKCREEIPGSLQELCDRWCKREHADFKYLKILYVFLVLLIEELLILIYMFLEMMQWSVRGLSCKPNIYVSWSTSELLGKGWPLGSRLWCLTVSLSLSNWYPGSGMVFDCIDSWSLHHYLLSFYCNDLGHLPPKYKFTIRNLKTKPCIP